MTMFITIEGPEGSGKTTQIRLLADWLTAQGQPVLLTREPGGTVIGNAVRAIVLDPAYTEMSPRAETLLYNAARAQLVDQVIQPALARGEWVLCDRYADSTLAYQGYGHGQPLGPLRLLGDYATNRLMPDLTVYLDIDAGSGLARKQGGPAEEWNRFEQKQLAYHQQVRQGYLELAAAEPARWLVVDAADSVESVHRQLAATVAERGQLPAIPAE